MPCTVPSSPSLPCRALKTQSNPPSRKTSHVLRSISTAVTSWPRPRSASCTWAPERSETSRSAERPPQSTAILTEMGSPPCSDDLDLRLELGAKAALDLGLHLLDQRAHVGRLRAPFVDDEVA